MVLAELQGSCCRAPMPHVVSPCRPSQPPAPAAPAPEARQGNWKARQVLPEGTHVMNRRLATTSVRVVIRPLRPKSLFPFKQVETHTLPEARHTTPTTFRRLR